MSVGGLMTAEAFEAPWSIPEGFVSVGGTDGTPCCRRCRGAMESTPLHGDAFIWGWKCLTCGEVIERGILFNRARRPAAGTRGAS